MWAAVILAAAGIVFAALGFHAVGFPERLAGASYDSRCGELIELVGGGGRASGVNNRTGVRVSDAQAFIEFRDRFEAILGYFQEDTFGRTTQKSIRAEPYNEFVPIAEVSWAKLLPPAFSGTRLPYLSWTMGGMIASGDVDGDGVPDPVVSTANWRCAKGRYDAVIMSSKIHQARGSVFAENAGGYKLVSSRWNRAEEQPAAKHSNYKSAMIRGESAFLFDGRLFRARVMASAFSSTGPIDIDRLSIPVPCFRGHVIFLDESVVVPDGQNLYFYEIGDDWRLSRIRRVSVEYAEENPFRIYPLPDLDGDSRSELAIVLPDRLKILLSSRDFGHGLDILFGELARTGFTLIGNKADFDGDGRTDFWLSFPESMDGEGHTIGRVFLLTNEALAAHVSHQSVRLDQVTSIEIDGSPRYDGSPFNGIGYDMSDTAGDIDGDGKPDFATVAHYALNNAGALYLILGSDLFKRKVHSVAEGHVVRIMGAPLSYLGTGLYYGSDYSGDGYADILVGADVDHEAGFSAGALYILSGKAIADRAKRARSGAL